MSSILFCVIGALLIILLDPFRPLLPSPHYYPLRSINLPDATR